MNGRQNTGEQPENANDSNEDEIIELTQVVEEAKEDDVIDLTEVMDPPEDEARALNLDSEDLLDEDTIDIVDPVTESVDDPEEVIDLAEIDLDDEIPLSLDPDVTEEPAADSAGQIDLEPDEEQPDTVPEETETAVREEPQEAVPVVDAAPGSTVDVSFTDEQLEAALERTVEKLYAEKIERLMIETIEKTVTREIEKIKRSLTGSDDNMPG